MAAWLNGEIVEQPLIPADSAGALLGYGVFTTVGITSGRPMFMRRHYERLCRDARKTGLSLPYAYGSIRTGLEQLLELQKITEGMARLTLLGRWDGGWSRTEGSDFFILAKTAAPPPSEMHLKVADWRPDPSRPLADVKTTSYLPYLHVWLEAREARFHEALLQNSEGFVCEGARSSLFWRRKLEWFTPSLSTGCLAGIGRDALTQLLGTVNTGQFPLEDLLSADAILTVSAAAGPRWAGRIRAGDDEFIYAKPTEFDDLLTRWKQLARMEFWL